ncbi:response regulator transcription factor [Sporolactobacillus pectinivorans]|uniref:response regulator transcription factor n=1 Tax=Sporolactobacillus pectinivorans TaxID=1591408 RepID=UPI000C258759|nr:response regulator transcription factor [Sporolactobacillus pectinivorans]
MNRVLVVEDEKSICSFISLNLRHSGYDVIETDTGEKALDELRRDPRIRMILLDVMLPGINGFEVCHRIRESNPDIGIIILTAKIQEEDKVRGLKTGADDYITKPFSPAEMLARVQALLRRMDLERKKRDQNNGIIRSSLFTLSLDDEQFYKGDELIELTPTEFELVKVLMENENKLLSRRALLESVWGKNFVGDMKIIDVNIRRIRQKIEDDPSSPQYIATHWGKGYIWTGENQ